MAPSQSALLTIFAALAGGVEVEETLELRAHAGDVERDLFGGEQIALLRLAARIADHAGAAADDGDGRVAEPLQAREPHHGEQVAHVQARRRRVEPDVRRDPFFRERFRHAIGYLGNHAAPLEFLKQIHLIPAGLMA